MRTSHIAATASNSRPALDVNGEPIPLVTMRATMLKRGWGIGSNAGGSGTRICMSHEHAIRQGSRIAPSPPGMRTPAMRPARSKPASPPRRISPPQIVPSLPRPVPS